MVFLQNQSVNILYPNVNYQFVLVLSKKNLESFHERSSSYFKKKLWFPTKWRVQMVFSLNESINIVYPNVNYLFVLVVREKNLDFCHKQSSSFF